MRFEKVSISQYSKDIEGDFLFWGGREYYIGDILKGSTKLGSFKSMEGMSVVDIYNDIKLPQRATKKSAGYDIFAPYDFTLSPGQTMKIATGIRVILDDDKFLMCAPRSGHGFKARIQLDNTLGIIDADYSDSENEGHIMLKLTNDSKSGKSISVKKGDGMAQAIILQYFTVDNDETTRLRNGGFGSTDIKEGASI